MKDKIAAIPDENEDYTCFSLMYTSGDGVEPKKNTSIGGSCDCDDIKSISKF